MVEYWSSPTYGPGSAFGSALFPGESELILPTLGLMPAPSHTPSLLHEGGLTAHAIFGTGTEADRSVVHKAL